LALIVVVPVVTEMEPVYSVEEDVGSAPFVVYLIVAPLVLQEMETDWATVYVPPTGLKTGVATFPCQIHVMMESCVTVKVVEVPLPDEGTDPVPVQPVQVQVAPPSTTGLETLQVTDVPEL